MLFRSPAFCWRANYPLFDPLGGFVVAGFILYTAFEILRAAVHELMDTRMDVALATQVAEAVRSVPGVARVVGMADRTLADVTIIEVHIDVDPAMPAGAVGQLIDAIRQRLIGALPGIGHVVVEVNSSLHEPAALDRGRCGGRRTGGAVACRRRAHNRQPVVRSACGVGGAGG